MTSTDTLVNHRRGEEDIWRAALDMNPRMTETRIDDFIATPTDMGDQKDYLCLLQSLHMRTTRASTDRRCPVDSPPLSIDEWRKMQRDDEWVRRATQSSLPKDSALERTELVLSMFTTFSHRCEDLHWMGHTTPRERGETVC
jgi:hypothetical protein